MFKIDHIGDAIDILEKAQRHYPGGDELNRKLVRQELLEVCDLARNAADDEPFEFDVIERPAIDLQPSDYAGRPVRSPWRPIVSGRSRKREKQRPLRSLRDILFGLRNMAEAKRPLSSEYCRNTVVIHVNQALRVYERPWLQSKEIDVSHPVQFIRQEKKRLKSEDHERIRSLINDRIIPNLTLMKTKEKNALKNWKQSAVLELADLFTYYAPPKNYDTLGITSLPGGTATLFIQFLYKVFEFIGVDDVSTRASLSNYWIAQKKIMLGALENE